VRPPAEGGTAPSLLPALLQSVSCLIADMEDLDSRWRSPSPPVIPSRCCLMRSMLEAGSNRRYRTIQIEIICHRASIARNVLAHYLGQAVAESKLAYRFSPSSYSYSCLNACLAAEQALEVLRDTLDAAAET